MNEKCEKEQRIYDAYYQKMAAIEIERESIERRKRELDADRYDFEDVYRQMHDIFKSIAGCCDDEHFIRELEECSDEFHDLRNKVDRELDEKEDDLQREEQSTYEQEEIIREELRKKKELLNC